MKEATILQKERENKRIRGEKREKGKLSMDATPHFFLAAAASVGSR